MFGLFKKFHTVICHSTFNFWLTTGLPVFKIVSSRAGATAGPPDITVHFADGIKDALILEEYKINKESPAACNYIGGLKSHPSTVAVTGCMRKPGDRMEVTLLSEHNHNSMMYSVDFLGNTQVIESPFKNGGR